MKNPNEETVYFPSLSRSNVFIGAWKEHDQIIDSGNPIFAAHSNILVELNLAALFRFFFKLYILFVLSRWI